jgi:acyl-CoA thioester hydrolase
MTRRKPFSFPVRVYYEDTDAGGVVYYANYLKFMERARSEWLAAIGFPLAEVERELGVTFVVRHLTIDFHAGARFGDALDVTVEPISRGASRLVASQDVRRGEETLTAAKVTLACLDRARWRPTRMPAPLAAAMEIPA